jgi:hypothetical protein
VPRSVQAKEQVVQLQAQLEASNDKLAWSEHKNAIMSELYFVNLEQVSTLLMHLLCVV